MKESRSSAAKILLCAAVLIASVLLCSPVSAALEKLTGDLFDWTVPFRLAAMVSGLVLLAAVIRLMFQKWAPKTNRGRTAFTLSSSALRYLFGLVGLMWALSILGVNVEALLAGAGVVALIIGFGAESLIADVVTGIFMLFEHEYEVGDIIVTSGLGGSYERGLVIGTVVSVNKTETDAAGDIIVDPNGNASMLEEVIVVFSAPDVAAAEKAKEEADAAKAAQEKAAREEAEEEGEEAYEETNVEGTAEDYGVEGYVDDQTAWEG